VFFDASWLRGVFLVDLKICSTTLRCETDLTAACASHPRSEVKCGQTRESIPESHCRPLSTCRCRSNRNHRTVTSLRTENGLEDERWKSRLGNCEPQAPNQLCSRGVLLAFRTSISDGRSCVRLHRPLEVLLEGFAARFSKSRTGFRGTCSQTRKARRCCHRSFGADWLRAVEWSNLPKLDRFANCSGVTSEKTPLRRGKISASGRLMHPTSRGNAVNCGRLSQPMRD
jgi:hypothetical protein